jgi:hypothetical protein
MHVRGSLALLLAATSCTTTYNVPKTEISRLNGWFVPDLVKRQPGDGRVEDPGAVQLRDTQGREHKFTEDTPLVLTQRNGAVIAEKYLDVSVDGEHFRGVPMDGFRRVVEVPLSDVQSAGLREISVGKTALLLSGIALGLVGAFLGAKLAIGDPPEQPPTDPCGDLGCPF